MAKADGILPHGTIGEKEYDLNFHTVSAFLNGLKNYIKDYKAETLSLDFCLGNFRLTGTINNLYENRLIKYRCAKIKPKDIISLWIEHLAFNLSVHTEKKSSILSGLGDKKTFEAWEFSHTHNSKAILQTLCELYFKGHQCPLPFFPEASFAYAKSFQKEQDTDLALRSAEKTLLGDEYSTGDLNDAYQNLCFKDISCLDELFQETAHDVYGPIMNNRKKLKQ